MSWPGWLWVVTGPVGGVVCGVWSVWWTDGRRRRREARAARLHVMLIRLVDPAGNTWIELDCEQLQAVHKYGSGCADRDEWFELENINGMRLQTRPAFQD